MELGLCHEPQSTGGTEIRLRTPPSNFGLIAFVGSRVHTLADEEGVFFSCIIRQDLRGGVGESIVLASAFQGRCPLGFARHLTYGALDPVRIAECFGRGRRWWPPALPTASITASIRRFSWRIVWECLPP